ncbi:phosphotransferase [Kitasatospora terrestris]
MMIGELLGIGRTADVYALDDGRVLRRYRDGSDTAGELAVMTHLARHDYPVAAAWPGTAPGELVMERLAGPTLREALASGTTGPEEAGELLADLLRRLHAVPARHSADPAHRILHLDFHPENVMLAPRGPVVIDWATADEGEPGLDVAMSALILAQAAVTMPAVAELARALLVPFLRRLEPPTAGQLERVRAIRAANPTLTEAETAGLGQALELIRAAL